MRTSTSPRAALALACVAFLAGTAPAAAPRADVEFFEKRIRPVLVEHCQGCHGPKVAQGGLRVDSRDALRKGGNSGPGVVPGKPEQSWLIKAVRHTDASLQMPPESKLPDAAIADLEKWVKMGAPDPRDKAAAMRPPLAHRHWAFRPVRSTAPPAVRDASWARTPLDRFLLAKLEARGLKPAPEADRLTLVRRLTFDLTGLPPRPEEVDDFLGDESPDAYEKLVDRLLASPAYGERWGRHWLDLARYADTAGETADIPAPHAWRYRNHVLDAFNGDVPYDRFVREQIAGDLLARAAPDGERAGLIVATGYLAVARRFGFDILADHPLTIEDTIDTIGKSILGLTVGCARCHDHKYDPISQKDYYALYGILDSTRFPFSGCEKDRKPRDLVALPVAGDEDRKLGEMRKELAAVEADLRKANEDRLRVGRAFKEAAKAARVLGKGDLPDGGRAGFGEKVEPFEVRPGQLILFSVAPGANHGADSTLVELEILEEGGKERRWSAADLLDGFLASNPLPGAGGAAWCFLDLRDGPALLSDPVKGLLGKAGLNVWRRGETPSVWVNAARQPVAAWTTLPARSFFIHPGPAGAAGVAWVSPLAGKVRVRGRLEDVHKGGTDGVRWRLEHLAAPLGEGLRELAEVEASLGRLQQKRAAVEKQLGRVPLAYAVQEGSPHDARLHRRGDPEKLGPVVPRGFLSALGGQKLPADEKGSGRLHLARWLTEPKNPLTARVMVNRIWQHHFGRGIVATPSDFGTRGEPPSHPELLDHLAARFVEGGWSVKAMHRLIVLSSAYRQSSRSPEAVKADPDNALLGRFARRRLSAEEIRDAILSAAGSLDRTPGGPHPFPDEKGWNYTQHNPFTAAYETDRRSVYLMVQRLKRHPFLGLFDGADPSSSTAARDTTTVPTQALFFLNDPFVHAAADRLAAHLMTLPGDEKRAEEVHRRCLGRRPTERERRVAARFVASAEGEARARWSAWARVVMAGNEFVYVD